MTDMLAELKRALEVVGTFTYTATYSKLTGKISYSVSGNSGVQPMFIFATDLFDTLGFDKNTTNTFVANSIQSTNVANLNPYECVYIRSDMTATSFGTILDIVPMVLSPNGAYVYYQNTSDHTQRELVSNHNTVFTFTITDSNNVIIDLNGKDISFVLCIHRDTREMTEDLMRENILITNQEAISREKERPPIQNQGTIDESVYTIGFK
jgi:hypothetical protein